jgi:hypothetical protein
VAATAIYRSVDQLIPNSRLVSAGVMAVMSQGMVTALRGLTDVYAHVVLPRALTMEVDC